jgi:hypothetical protein
VICQSWRECRRSGKARQREQKRRRSEEEARAHIVCSSAAGFPWPRTAPLDLSAAHQGRRFLARRIRHLSAIGIAGHRPDTVDAAIARTHARTHDVPLPRPAVAPRESCDLRALSRPGSTRHSPSRPRLWWHATSAHASVPARTGFEPSARTTCDLQRCALARGRRAQCTHIMRGRAVGCETRSKAYCNTHTTSDHI